ncbi:hypothetical protein J4Q44_G00285000 [Coregonus suidteri]|uniref:Uncharacterized protein n=1 Tax=Coregonus suidteri TaxID=861788 RepID=A0AAN8KZC6_9TELE
MKDYQISVSQNHTQCGKVMNSTTEYCSPEKYCKSIECESFLFGEDNSTSFHQTQIDVQAEIIIPPHRQLMNRTGVGVGIFLLIIATVAMYMMVCFKRKRFVDNAQEGENEGEQSEAR